MTLRELEKTIMGYMDSFSTMTLAASADNLPWAADVFYARRKLDLVFFSSPNSRHSRIFSANARAAATIHGDYQGWREIKGLQMEGTIETVSGTKNLIAATAVYLRRFPFVQEFFSQPETISSDLASKVSKVKLYVFRPELILYINNEVGFGKRWKMEVSQGRAMGMPEFI